jgi:hypothetical protein
MAVVAEELCRRVYAETQELNRKLGLPLGFRILYGPPIANAPILFLGYQPGGGADEARAGSLEGQMEGWRERFVYASAAWPLAERLREVFGAALLRECTGLNAIFFRSPNMAHWQDQPPDIREKAERFCLERAEQIVRALRPERIVTIGIRTFDLLGGYSGRVEIAGAYLTLLKVGRIWDRPAFGMVHVTGAQPTARDRKRLQDFFAPLTKVYPSR